MQGDVGGGGRGRGKEVMLFLDNTAQLFHYVHVDTRKLWYIRCTFNGNAKKLKKPSVPECGLPLCTFIVQYPLIFSEAVTLQQAPRQANTHIIVKWPSVFIPLKSRVGSL